MVEVAMTEVEIKLPVPDRQKLIEDLIGLGFKTGNTILETDVYFDSSKEEIRKNGEALRIRRIQNLETGELCSVITFKGKKLDQQHSIFFRGFAAAGGKAGCKIQLVPV